MDINMAFSGNMSHGHHMDLGCSKILAPDMTLNGNMNPDIAMDSDVRVGHSQCCLVSTSASLHSTLLSLCLHLSTTDLLATEVPTCLSPTCAGMWQASLLNGDAFSVALLCYQRFCKGWWGWAISY